MSLSPGSRIGPYSVVSHIGAGGMGEVYRARDSKLDRDVAIKVLPESFAGDADRVARFTREAKSLAALNHPNIAAIYGIEEQGATRALVMELVDGDDLSTLIARGALPIADALAIARQLVDALEAAHESGLIHRDLKPANIKVKADGTVKVLDFGLAKAVSGDPSSVDAMNSPTITARGTEMGIIVGTAAYMSPEQAKGRAVDKRADIWAFGCVLYEMLTGRRAFSGEDVSDTLAAVLRDTPDFAALPATVPARVRVLVQRTLDKNVKLRLRDIGDARADLVDGADAPTAPANSAGAATPPTRRTAITWLGAGLAMGAAGGWAWARSTMTAPRTEQWAGVRIGGSASGYYPVISPNGDLMAFAIMVDGLDQVAVMRPTSGRWTVLTNDRAHGTLEAMCWAPDGSRIYFERRTDSPVGIFSVPALGGEQRLVLDAAAQPIALRDGSLLVSRFNEQRQLQLHRFRSATGQLEPLAFVVPNILVLGQQRELPDGRVLLSGWPLADTKGAPRIYAMSPDGTRFTPLVSSPELSRALWISAQPGTTTAFAGYPDGTVSVVLRFDADRPDPPQRLFNASASPIGDVDAKGNVYIGSIERNVEALSLRQNARTERLGVIAAQIRNGGVVALGNGQLAAPSDIDTTPRVVVASPTHDFVPLLDTDEPSRGPLAAIGANTLVMLVGVKPDFALVDITTGQISRRFPAPEGITGMGASPDGRTLYYEVNGMISAMPIDGGASRVVGPGNSFAVDPATGDLIVKLLERDAVRIARQPAAGGPHTIIETHGTYRVTPQRLLPGAVREGRLAVSIASVDSWYWMPGTVDLKTGRIEKLANDYQSDIHYLTWRPDGTLVATGFTSSFAIWKYSATR